jgi:hypothetical protein
MSPRTLAPCALLLLAGIAPAAHAYGPEGHAMIADMAEHHLSEGAATEVRRLLAIEGHMRLDEVSSWPDAIRAAQPSTGPWHFVDIPLNQAGYDEARDCHEGGSKEANCVASELPRLIAVLASPRSKSPNNDAVRLDALKWVVHLVGDAHQPLHDADNADRGGNDVRFWYFGAQTNLHSVWDGGVIEHNYGWKPVAGPDYDFDHRAVAWAADRLDDSITPAQRASWVGALATPADVSAQTLQWIQSTHTLAPAAYAGLANKGTPNWDQGYQEAAWPVIRDQLRMASVRLAAVLNAALK